MTENSRIGSYLISLLAIRSKAPRIRRRGLELNLVEQLECRTLLAGTAAITSGQEYTVLSSSPDGTFIGTVEANQSGLSFQLIGGDLEAFKIEASTGKIKVNDPSRLTAKLAPEVLTVKVTDTSSPEQIGTGTVTIFVNHPPAFTATNFVFPGVPGVDEVLGAVTAIDPDPGQSLTYSIVLGNEGSIFTLDSATGQLKVVNSTAFAALAFPKTLAIQVLDSSSRQGVDTALVTITAPPAPPLPNVAPVIVDPADVTLLSTSPVGTVVATIVANDLNPGQTKTFSLEPGPGNIGAFSIDPASGKITVANISLVNGLAPDVLLTIKVADNGSPSLFDTTQLTIHINRPPILNPVSFTVPSTIAAGDEIGTVVATDVDAGQSRTYFITAGNDTGAFAINTSNGKITVANKPAFDILSFPVMLTVEVRDSVTSPVSSQGKDTAIVTINLSRPPLLEANKFSVLTNVDQGFVIGTVQTPLDSSGETKTYRISDGNDGAFAISNTGVITVANVSLLNVLGPTVDLVVEVTSSGNIVPAIVPVQVRLNRPPVIQPATFIVKTEYVKGSVVGIVIGQDSDLPGTPEAKLTYFLTAGNDTGAFAINQNSGQITVANKAAFDTLVYPVNLTVEVRDGGAANQQAQGKATAQVTIVLDGPPVVSGQILFLYSKEASTYHIGEPPVRLDPKAVFRLGAGALDTFEGASLTVVAKAVGTRLKPGILSVVSDEPGNGRISVAGESILYGDKVIGKFDRVQARQGKLVIEFNKSTTAASIQATLKRIGLKAHGQASERTVTMTFSGIDALPASQRTTTPKTVNVVKRVRPK